MEQCGDRLNPALATLGSRPNGFPISERSILRGSTYAAAFA